MAVAEEPADGVNVDQVATLLEFVIEADESTAVDCLQKIIQHVQSGELKREPLDALRTRLSQVLRPRWSKASTSPLHDASVQLAVLWGDAEAVARARQILADADQSSHRRGVMLSTLAATGDSKLVAEISCLLTSSQRDPTLQTAALSALGRFDSPEVAATVLKAYPTLAPEVQAQAVTLLTQRAAWSRQLVVAVQSGTLPSAAVGGSHLRSLLASRDPELAAMVKKQWGAVRTERNPEREQVIANMRELLARQPGDAFRGQAVFQRVCGQCHKIHGLGQEVGPDITSNGRSTFDQLLSNVLDPSLVIGPAYQAVTVVTAGGRVLTGLLAEDSDQRIVLKTQGGKLETIARGDVEEVQLSKLSLMPENLEQQLKPEELTDLFAFLALDKPPADPNARWIPGAPPFTEQGIRSTK
jgi:putative heme-binding domain-containing protein